MKKIQIMLVMVAVCACHHETESWKEPGTEEVAVQVRANSTVAGESAGCQLFLFNGQNQLTAYTVSASGMEAGNRFRLNIPEGHYTGYCVLNATDPEVLEYTSSGTPAQTYVKLKPEGEFYREAGDYLIGKSEFSVPTEGSLPIEFNVERRVGCVRVIIENVPEWMSDIRVRISAVPPKMSLSGKYPGEGIVVEKTAALPDAGQRSVTNVLVYPPAKSSVLTLAYKAGVSSGVTASYTLDSVVVNHITEVKAIFGISGKVGEVDFSAGIRDWDENIIRGEDWYIDLPDGPCSGAGNGVNIVKNGGFEEEMSGNVPAGWKLDAGGADKKVVSVNSPVAEGSQAVRMEGKTYLYQDVAVEAGQCYQLHMYVNALTGDVKWRYWCTWMAGSTSLKSDEIRMSAYRNQTEGYEDVFAGNIFKAPEGATKLRMEMRTYTATVAEGVGLYVDGVRVEKVE